MMVQFLVGAGLLLAGVGAGFRVRPKSYAVPAPKTPHYSTVNIPSDLPAPVSRYAEAVFGTEIPVIKSALLIGRVDLRLGRIPMRGRFKIYHEAGSSYYHLIEVTWFGFPIMTVNERYHNGEAILALPVGRVENNPKVNDSANLGLWAESLAWLPSILFTDDRVQWESVDDHTARLIVPNSEVAFTVCFDPYTGLFAEATTLRYRDKNDNNRLRWTNRVTRWSEMNGIQIPLVAETQWGDEKPWAVWHTEAVIYNLDVSARLNQFGGEYVD